MESSSSVEMSDFLTRFRPIYDQIMSDVLDDTYPSYPPPSHFSDEELIRNLKRWKRIRQTGCNRMQETFDMVEEKLHEGVWYHPEMLDQAEEIIKGGERYQAEGKTNPNRAEYLRALSRSGQKDLPRTIYD
jgi:hypothetical protein